MKPTVGRIVHYALSEYDIAAINRGTQRQFNNIGNAVEVGQICPAMIVRVFDPEGGSGTANLQVFLDGSDSYWATSRKNGDEPGTWTGA